MWNLLRDYPCNLGSSSRCLFQTRLLHGKRIPFFFRSRFVFSVQISLLCWIFVVILILWIYVYLVNKFRLSFLSAWFWLSLDTFPESFTLCIQSFLSIGRSRAANIISLLPSALPCRGFPSGEVRIHRSEIGLLN